MGLIEGTGIEYMKTAPMGDPIEYRIWGYELTLRKSDYPKLMELQSAVDAEEANQDSLLERMLETETELAEYEEA